MKAALCQWGTQKLMKYACLKECNPSPMCHFPIKNISSTGAWNRAYVSCNGLTMFQLLIITHRMLPAPWTTWAQSLIIQKKSCISLTKFELLHYTIADCCLMITDGLCLFVTAMTQNIPSDLHQTQQVGWVLGSGPLLPTCIQIIQCQGHKARARLHAHFWT